MNNKFSPQLLLDHCIHPNCSFEQQTKCPFTSNLCKKNSTFEGINITTSEHSSKLSSLDKMPFESLYLYNNQSSPTCVCQSKCTLYETSLTDFKTSTCLKLWKLQDKILEIEQLALSTLNEEVLHSVDYWVISTLKTVFPDMK
jgi:hypothetical protein